MKNNILIKITVFFLITAVMVLLLTYIVTGIVILGPSDSASRLLVTTLTETSAAKFIPRLYMSKARIENIINRSDESTDIFVNSELIDLPTNSETAGSKDIADIEIFDVKGATFNGKMMVVADPSRIFLGIPQNGFGEEKRGMTVNGMIKFYGAVGGINAGGFYDPNGNGTGGIPDGIVIHEGELLWGDTESYYSIAGIDKSGLLHVGKMTGATALEKELEYAVSYGPALIINGIPQNEKADLGGGLNPRTAIGQRADGAILLLVVNGRSVESLGATYDDLVEIFLEHGAVNATNLDGGSSSLMIYEGKSITKSAYVYGERIVATSILIK